MDKLGHEDGAEKTADQAGVLLMNLQADDRTKKFGVALAPQVGRLTTGLRLHSDVLEARKAATARVDYLDDVLDGAGSDLEFDTLKLVRKNREDSRYMKLWGTRRVSDLNVLPFVEQIREVRGLARVLEADPELEPLRHHAAPLGTAASDLEGGLAARELLEGQLDDAAREVRIATDVVRRAYNKTFRQLLDELDDDVAAAESFFPRQRERDSRPESQPPVPPPADPAPPSMPA